MAEHDEQDRREDQDHQNQGPEGEAGEGKKKRRRRRRRRRGRGEREGQQPQQQTSEGSGDEAATPAEGAEAEGATEGASEEPDSRPRKKRSRRRRRGGRDEGADERPREEQPSEGQPPEQRPARQRAATPAVADDPELFDLQQTFADLGLIEPLQRAVDEAGFLRPTHIQAQLIPPALTGRDVLGQAKTGTGKTAAFGIPALQRIEPGQKFACLILAPTRELAIQIREELLELSRFSEHRIAAVYGGQRISQQVEALAKGPEIIVGTPGRVMDMEGRGHLSFRNVRMAVLDEVDRMLDIGFRDDIRRILGQCPEDRQTMMVSATISGEIEELARRYMRDAEKIITSSGSLTVKLVEQHYLTVDPWDKRRLLIHLLTHEEPALTLIFCRLKRSVDELERYLNKKGIEAHAIHGDMRQSQRDKVMRTLREGKLEVLIASDLAARGIDVQGITHVINYDLPEDPEIYVHRIGRTARAGRGGIAWTFVTPEQGKLLTQVEKLINDEIPKMEYPDFEPSERPESYREQGVSSTGKVVESPPPKSRLAEPTLPDADAEDEKKKAELEKQFPGGVVPTQLPPRRLRGKMRTRR